MMNALMEQGEVTGAEAYLVEKAYEGKDAKKRVAPFGLEAKEAYRSNLEQFR